MMISLLIRFINICLIVILAMLIYKNRGNNSWIVIALFAVSVVIFVVNYII